MSISWICPTKSRRDERMLVHFLYPATSPRRMSTAASPRTLKPTLSLVQPLVPLCGASRLTLLQRTWDGLKTTVFPTFKVPVSILPTGTVPIREIF